MLLILASLFIFGSIVSLIIGLGMKQESVLNVRMAALKGERPATTYRMATQTEGVGTRVIGPLASSLGGKLSTLLPTKWVSGFEKQLIAAGEPVSLKGFLGAMAISEAALLFFAFVMLSSGNLDGKASAMALLGCSGMGVLMPKVWLSSRVQNRQKAIGKALPDAFDLITTCVEAGLGLDAALARVAEKVEGPFAEEMAITMREISLGKLRRDALKEMADRIQLPDLSTFITAVVQAESMGTSIATVLRVQAEQMRTKRRQRAEQQAQQAPVKMIFPLVLCIFPTLFLVILGPAALTVYDTLIKD